MTVTIINETTGQTLYNNGSFGNGQVINLPFSETMDQSFRFYVEQVNHGHFWETSYAGGKGVMVLYVDRVNRKKVANVKWVQESCNEI